MPKHRLYYAHYPSNLKVPLAVSMRNGRLIKLKGRAPRKGRKKSVVPATRIRKLNSGRGIISGISDIAVKAKTTRRIAQRQQSMNNCMRSKARFDSLRDFGQDPHLVPASAHDCGARLIDQSEQHGDYPMDKEEFKRILSNSKKQSAREYRQLSKSYVNGGKAKQRRKLRQSKRKNAKDGRYYQKHVM